MTIDPLMPLARASHCAVLGAVLAIGCGGRLSLDEAAPAAGGASHAGSGGVTNSGGVAGSDPVDDSPCYGDGSGVLPIDPELAEKALSQPEATCQGWAIEAEAEPVLILFLVDVSGSMLSGTPTTSGQTKWVVTRDALKAVVPSLPESFGVGISFFPNMGIVADSESVRPSTACIDPSGDVPVAPATSEQKARLVAALDRMKPHAQGARPTHDAFNAAVEQLKGGTLPGRRHVVLVTDGLPTQSLGCVGAGSACDPAPTDPIVAAIGQAYSDSSIGTFVVGSVGSERNECTNADVRSWLSRAARAGNTAAENCSDGGVPYCHIDVSQTANLGVALRDALDAIVKTTIPCEYRLPESYAGAEVDPTLFNVYFSDGLGNYWAIVPQGPPGCGGGWSFVDSSKNSIQVTGDICNVLRVRYQTKIDLLYGCRQSGLW